MEIDLEEELNKRVNYGDLDDDGDNARYLYNTMMEVELERSNFLLGDDGIEQADEGGINSVFLHFGETMDPDAVKVPKPPDDWVDPAPNKARGGGYLRQSGQPSWMDYPLLPPCICVWITRIPIQFSLSPSWLSYSSVKWNHAAICTHGGWIILPRLEEGGTRWWCEGEHFWRGSSSVSQYAREDIS